MKKKGCAHWSLSPFILKSILTFLTLMLLLIDPSGNSRLSAEDDDEKDRRDIKTPAHIGEIIEERTEFSKAYNNENGSITKEVHAVPIHYRDEKTGQFEPIDLTISGVPVSFYDATTTTIYSLSAERNVIKTYFTSPSGEGHILRAVVGNHDITWEPLSLSWSLPGSDPVVSIPILKVPAVPVDNSVLYSGIFPNVDEEFQVFRGRIKDKIILHWLPQGLSGLVPEAKLLISGIVTLSQGLSLKIQGVDPVGEVVTSLPLELTDKIGGTVLIIEPPDVYDSSNPPHKAPALYHLIKQGLSLRLSVVIQASWLQDPSRIWPVIVDPTITRVALYDTYIGSGCPDSNYSSNNVLRVGYDTGGAPCPWDKYLMRALLKFSSLGIPSCLPTSNITGALYLRISVSDLTGSFSSIQAWRITQSWVSTTVTWNNQPTAANDNNEIYTPPASGSDYWTFWDITNTVRNWHIGIGDPGNLGLMLIGNQASGDNWSSFYSVETSVVSHK